MDAPALASDERVGRFVEQHEHRLDRRRIGLVAKTDQLIDIDQREIAGIGGHARDRVRRSVGDIGTDGEPLRAEKAMVQRHHKRRYTCFERTVERKLDCDRLLGVIGRRAFYRTETYHTDQARERGQHAPDCNGLTCAHLTTPGPDRLAMPCGRFLIGGALASANGILAHQT